MKSMNLDLVAKRINWYMPSAEVLANPRLFLCQVMARGAAADIVTVQRHYDKDAFIDAYRHAPPGLFDNPSWAYWGLVLLGSPEALPRPVRFPEAACNSWRGQSAGRWD